MLMLGQTETAGHLGPKDQIWAVLQPRRGSADLRSSIHDRKGTLQESETGCGIGYWGRVATSAAPLRPHGVLCEKAIFFGFPSLEEALTFLENAGCCMGEILDCRRRGTAGARA